MDYQCYGLGRVDITGSETVQRDLKTIRVPAHDGKGVDGKNTDYIATLSWVRAVILELPDHPKVGDVQSAVRRVREKFAQQAANRRTETKAGNNRDRNGPSEVGRLFPFSPTRHLPNV